MSFHRLSKVHAGRFKNTSWQDSISGMLLQRTAAAAAAVAVTAEGGGGGVGEKQLEGKRLAVVLDSGVSLFPHYFARIPCRIWRKNGNEKPRPCAMKKKEGKRSNAASHPSSKPH